MSPIGNYIELDRRFTEYTPTETPERLAERSYLAAFHGLQQGISWDELLQHRLVVILGEPGSGKTQELHTQQQKHRSTHFFLPLNRLVDEDVSAILDDDETRRFDQWKSKSYDATFFLDAVDESKLKQDNDFFTALDRVRKAIGPSMIRARFVISSRISEWRPQTDQHGVIQRLGEPQNYRKPDSANDRQGETPETPPIKIVTLLPLDAEQVKRFAAAQGVRNPQLFINALNENNALAFAGRPLDVRHLYEYWNEKGQLSNLTDLSEFMIQRLLAEVENKEKQDPLTPKEARLGAEHLAAAVIFCRNLRIRIADDSGLPDKTMISPAAVLPENWSAKQRRALLDRALFDAASHGAISFHHRYHTEFLAASWIDSLMVNNCGLEALEGLLFARIDGERALRATLAPVAAWLAKSGDEPWRSRLRQWLLEAAPEIHLRHGDPASLPLDYRRQVLSVLIERYQGRRLVRLNADRAALARFANKELKDDITRYLLDSNIGESLRADLLLLVCDGKLFDCVPAALELFAEPTSSDSLKTYAAMVVRDIGNTQHRRQLWQLCIGQSGMSNTLTGCLCDALFPQAIGVDGLLELIRKSQPIKEYGVDLSYGLRPLLEQELKAADAKNLLEGILALVKSPPLLEHTNLSEHFIWLTDLIPICLQRLLSIPESSNEEIDLAVTAILVLEQAHSHGSTYLLRKEKEHDANLIKQAMSCNVALRSGLYWRRVSKYREKHGKEPEIFKLTGYRNDSTTISQDDVAWLLSEAGNDLSLPDRCLAFETAAYLLQNNQDSLVKSAWQLLRHAGSNFTLLRICRRNFWNRLRAPVMRIWLYQFRNKLLEKYWWDHRLYRLSQFKWKIYDKVWLWRHRGDLQKGFYPNTLCHFARQVADRDSSQYSGSDWERLTNDWSKSVVASVKQGCTVVWKTFAPPYPHEKTDKHAVDDRVVAGLAGLQTLWHGGCLDFAQLPADEVDLAIRYACNELNGLPEWFQFLVESRPVEAAKSLGVAVDGEWHLPVELEHVNDVVAKLARPDNTVEAVTQVISTCLRAKDPIHPRILEYALSAILRPGCAAVDELKTLAEIRIRQYSCEQPQWVTWMNIWLQLNALAALDYLENLIETLSAKKSDALMLRLCASMANDYGVRYGADQSSSLEPAALLRFIPLVCRYIRPSEDIDRFNQGTYSPGLRDHAQDLRSGLWERLKNHSGSEADIVLRILLDDPVVENERDWMLHLLDNRKGLRADDTAWQASDIRVFTTLHCFEPRSDYQLFGRINRLLNDIKDHIERSDNAANRLQLRDGDLEKDLRGFITQELRERSRNWFVVTQENEVDLEQRPDITIDRPELNSVPIEVKLANLKHWSLDKLLERLENQLVGQYLRPSTIRHGIYVLGNTDPKRSWKDPVTNEKLNFEQLVLRIQARAVELQAELREGVDGVEVIGIDFSDPRER
ncbi:hypothetical protein [Methylobacter sp.]|uniref:hypothetical protein n=1 Tax=Methylobacter sp. TaxID=2051955 RepID=UPI00120CDB72|nr:hypothetical protein [Methylobacter sp.]TAK64806.1 MAG: hypothetical protein EPO18_02075 [Methylobacter sp.]